MRIPYYQYFQFLSLLSCLFFYKDVKKQSMGAFLPLCILSFGTELLGSNIKLMGLTSNHFIQNIYLIISTPLYFYIYYRILNIPQKFRAAYKYIAIITSLLFFCNYLFLQGPTRINTLGIIFQQLTTILLSCALLFHLATDEKYFVILKQPYFWLAAGLLIFSLGTLVVMGMYQYIRINNLSIKNKNLYRIIMPVLNVILYSAYTYAFYLCKPKKKLYSLS